MVLFDFQLGSILGRLRDEEILELTLVDFYHVTLEFDVKSAHFCDNLKKLLDGSWGETRKFRSALDSESFARSCLAVGEDADVVAVNGTLDEAFGFFEDLSLGAVGAEDAVEDVCVFYSAFDRN